MTDQEKLYKLKMEVLKLDIKISRKREKEIEARRTSGQLTPAGLIKYKLEIEQRARHVASLPITTKTDQEKLDMMKIEVMELDNKICRKLEKENEARRASGQLTPAGLIKLKLEQEQRARHVASLRKMPA